MSPRIKLHRNERGKTVVRLTAMEGVAGCTISEYDSIPDDVRAALKGLRLPVGVHNAAALRVEAIKNRLGGIH